MSLQRSLDEFALFYEKIESGQPDPASEVRRDNHYEKATLPVEEVSKLSSDIASPITPENSPPTAPTA